MKDNTPSCLAPAYRRFHRDLLLPERGRFPFTKPLWHAFTEFGAREDTARYSLETTGFHNALQAIPQAVDAAAAWVHSVIQVMFAHDELLACDWEERTFPRTFQRTAPAEQLPASWKPAAYQGGALDDYVHARQTSFREHCTQALAPLPAELRGAIEQEQQRRRQRDWPSFQEQFRFQRTLQPDTYRDVRMTVPLPLVQVGLLVGETYYLIPACALDDQGNWRVGGERGETSIRFSGDSWFEVSSGRPVAVDSQGYVRYLQDDEQPRGRVQPASLTQVQGHLAAIFCEAAQARPTGAANERPVDLLLSQVPRCYQNVLRRALPPPMQAAVEQLRFAPVVINWNEHDPSTRLSHVRQTRRGTLDHAIVLIRTSRSMLFNVSHVMYDGLWALFLADLLTQVAVDTLPRVQAVPAEATLRGVECLTFEPISKFGHQASRFIPKQIVEVGAESTGVNLTALVQLRKLLAPHGVTLSVNDLLLLARQVHALLYQPGEAAQAAVQAVARLPQGEKLLRQIEASRRRDRVSPPALHLPVDGYRRDPRDRLFMVTWRVADLPKGLLPSLASLTLGELPASERKRFMSELAEAGAAIRNIIQLARQGKSFSARGMALLAVTPPFMREAGNVISEQLGFLNDRIKGRELFSNPGLLPPGSTVTKMTSAKAIGRIQTRIWLALTNGFGQLSLTVRDFQPYVTRLVELGQPNVAQTLAQDYLDGYTATLNRMVEQLMSACEELSATDPHRTNLDGSKSLPVRDGGGLLRTIKAK